MGDAYVGEIMMGAFSFAPQGWALCNGALLQIAQNQALYSLLGTRYGGDGKTTFGLPDLRGRTPICMDSNHNPIATKQGVETVALTTDTMPPHNHTFSAVNVAATNVVIGPKGLMLPAQTAPPAGQTGTPPNLYAPVTDPKTLTPLTVKTI
ncbi:MAG: tail fiber protein, partial [Deltaproteobacteria bacterium]|nr:tail fiber protein [Deltaproteobacteria bacterium]